jgi:hypothetical protein
MVAKKEALSPQAQGRKRLNVHLAHEVSLNESDYACCVEWADGCPRD